MHPSCRSAGPPRPRKSLRRCVAAIQDVGRCPQSGRLGTPNGRDRTEQDNALQAAFDIIGAVQLSRFASFSATRYALRIPLLLLAPLALAACFAAPALARPPIPPLEVRLDALDALTPGATARFRIAVVPRFAADEIRVEIRTGAEVRWVSGARAFRTDAKRDASVEREFTVRVPPAARAPLYVRVEAAGPNGVVWRRGVGMGLGPDLRAERARTVPDGRGGTALEFEA